MISKTVRIGSCLNCGHEVVSRQVMLDDPDTIRGIQLDWVVGITGYWAACSNRECVHHYGEGTLPERPRDLFPVAERSAEDMQKDLVTVERRIAAARRGEWG